MQYSVFLHKNDSGSKGKKQGMGLECIHCLLNIPVTPTGWLIIYESNTHT